MANASSKARLRGHGGCHQARVRGLWSTVPAAAQAVCVSVPIRLRGVEHSIVGAHRRNVASKAWVAMPSVEGRGGAWGARL